MTLSVNRTPGELSQWPCHLCTINRRRKKLFYVFIFDTFFKFL